MTWLFGSYGFLGLLGLGGWQCWSAWVAMLKCLGDFSYASLLGRYLMVLMWMHDLWNHLLLKSYVWVACPPFTYFPHSCSWLVFTFRYQQLPILPMTPRTMAVQFLNTASKGWSSTKLIPPLNYVPCPFRLWFASLQLHLRGLCCFVFFNRIYLINTWVKILPLPKSTLIACV